jgi:hypothetical protein
MMDQEFREMFEKLGLPLDTLLSEEPEISRSTEERILIGITFNNHSDELLSCSLCEQVSRIHRRSSIWRIDSLSPLPFLSAPVSKMNRENLSRLTHSFSAEQNLRIVAAQGWVEYGLLGSNGSVMSYGSCGPLMSAAVQACASLPRDSSWGNQAVMEFMGLESEVSVGISKELFFKLDFTQG